MTDLFYLQWKQLIQIVLAGGQVVGRAFLRAFRQELRASQQAAEQMRKMKQGAPKKSAADMTSGISLQVNCCIPYKRNLTLHQTTKHWPFPN